MVDALVSINHNCHADRVKLPDGVELPERSSALCGGKWGQANAEVGGRTANYEEFSFGLGILGNYFKNFLAPEENTIVGFIVRALTGSADFLEGKRDEGMYGKAYGHGVDELMACSEEELKHDERILKKFDKQENRYLDDLAQNERQKALYGERIVSKYGEWATQTSKIKPIVHFVSGILGNTWRTGIQTVVDFPARVWWRIRMFGKALHGNFITSVWDLTKFKFLSFGSEDASKKYESKAKELGKMSDEYFKSKHKDKYTSESDAGLGLYFRMLKDRMGEHWQNIWDPKTALERKRKDGFLKEITDKNDPNQTFENGYVDPNSVDDQRKQKCLAATDFTGPICAALGLVGTVVFDPLKIIWGFAGFESGRNLVNALSASRKSFSLINYIFRFIIPEMHAGKEYKKLEDDMKREGGPTTAIAELYYAKKSRYNNAILGLVMAAGNICEPILHLKRDIVGESKFGNFLIDSVIKFNDTFFLRFFSKRREVQGRIEEVKAIAQKTLGVLHVKAEDYNSEKLEQAMNARVMPQKEEPSIIEKVVGKVLNVYGDIKGACTGEDSLGLKRKAA